MSRVQHEKLIQDLKDIQSDFNAFKSAGQLVGGDSLLGYLTYGGGQYDYGFPMAASSELHYKLTFTYTTPSNAALTTGAVIDLFPFYSIDNPDVANNAIPAWSNGANVLMYLQPLPATNTYSQWYIALGNTDSSSHTAYLKFIFSGTCPGTWSLTSA